jgi:prepilin-type processing-associated H-X9-DG protein
MLATRRRLVEAVCHEITTHSLGTCLATAACAGARSHICANARCVNIITSRIIIIRSHVVPDSTPRLICVNDLPFGSMHSGGANFCFGDGSVKFLPDSLDVNVYLAMGSRNGDETVSSDF